jgi:hypothetical protein
MSLIFFTRLDYGFKQNFQQKLSLIVLLNIFKVYCNI